MYFMYVLIFFTLFVALVSHYHCHSHTLCLSVKHVSQPWHSLKKKLTRMAAEAAAKLMSHIYFG